MEKTKFFSAKISFLIILTIAIVLFAWPTVGYLHSPDWHATFRPAALEILHGRSPYNAKGFFNPPWAAILLIPFAVLPEKVGWAVLVVVALGVYAYVAHKLGANKLTIAILLLSPPSLHGILIGNIDWLAILGIVLPPWLGLFFLALKPQVSVVVILYLFVAEWKRGGPLRVFKTFLPVGLAAALSIMIFGPWFLNIPSLDKLPANDSLFPMSLPLGLVLTVAAIRKNDIRYAMMASPMLAPYLLLYSWIVALLALAPKPSETTAAVIGMWIVVLMRFFA